MISYSEYQDLIIKINKQRENIHSKSTEEISEAILDQYKHQITQFELNNPELVSPNSPNQTIAGSSDNQFQKFEHKRRMTSLVDIFDYKELEEWEKRWQRYLDKGE